MSLIIDITAHKIESEQKSERMSIPEVFAWHDVTKKFGINIQIYLKSVIYLGANALAFEMTHSF